MNNPGFRSPRFIAPALQLALAAASVLSLVVTIAQGIVGMTDAEMDATASTPGGAMMVMAFGLAAIAYGVSFFAGAILFPTFLYRANANLRALGATNLTTTPGMAAGGWFIPFANLVIPYRAIAEIEKASHPHDVPFTSSLVGAYWGCWIAGNIFSRIGEKVPAVAVFGSIALCAAGFIAIVIIRRIVANQELLAQRGNLANIAADFA